MSEEDPPFPGSRFASWQGHAAPSEGTSWGFTAGSVMSLSTEKNEIPAPLMAKARLNPPC